MDALKRYGALYLGVIAAAVVLSLVFSGVCEYAAASGTIQALPRPVVVVDAGHGGEDGGAVGPGGVLESQINLDITQRLEPLLALCGFEPVPVRDGDYAVYDSGCATIAQKKASDLRNRAKLVQETAPALLLSIHQNQFSDGRYSGAQVFYAPTSGSEALAGLLQQGLRDSLDPGNNRQCKPAGEVYLMQHVDCTAVLVECGFLSNSAEAAQLQQPDYQKKIACTIVAGLLQYFQENLDLLTF